MNLKLKDQVSKWWSDSCWAVRATFDSFRNAEIEHFPELRRGGSLVALNSDDLVAELARETKGFESLAPTSDITLDSAIELVKLSLEENKKQTEYQDDKASRLLTVTSFVSALSAVLFGSFIDRYPVDQIHPVDHGRHWILVLAYIAFVFFSLFALCGALVTFHATRTRFKYSADKEITDEDKLARSVLFYKGIIGTAPKGWAKSFLALDADKNVSTNGHGKASLRADLKELYLRHLVIETYLVAAKTADKLRYLGPAQALLSWAMRLLILFVILVAASVLWVSSLKSEPETAPVIVRSVPPPVIVNLPAPPPIANEEAAKHAEHPAQGRTPQGR